VTGGGGERLALVGIVALRRRDKGLLLWLLYPSIFGWRGLLLRLLSAEGDLTLFNPAEVVHSLAHSSLYHACWRGLVGRPLRDSS